MRPFFQQLTSAQAVYGQAPGYAVPEDNEYYAVTLDGNQDIGLDTVELYDEAGAVLGANLRDVELGYLVLLNTNVAVEATGATNAGTIRPTSIYEGAGASGADATGTVLTESFIREEGVDKTMASAVFFHSRPAVGRQSEWGVNVQSAVIEADRVRISGGTLVILPSLPNSFAGTTIGTEDNHWARALVSQISYNDQVGGDADQSNSANFTVGSSGEYLCFLYSRWNNGTTTTTHNLRFHWEVNGVDVFNVRTDVATSGAVKTGRGFQQFFPSDADLSSFRPYLFGAAVLNLNAGSNTVTLFANRHESADPANSEAIALTNILAIKTDRFKQVEKASVATVQASGVSNVFAEAPAFTKSITVDGQAKVLVILSTSVHYSSTADTSAFQIKRNGVLISPYDTSVFGGNSSPHLPSMFLGDASNGTAATGDSDNNTLPITIIVVDDPGPGTHTYTVESAVSGASAGIWNADDNGTDGYNGMLALVELSLKIGS